jgi:hypothetical protein
MPAVQPGSSSQHDRPTIKTRLPTTDPRHPPLPAQTCWHPFPNTNMTITPLPFISQNSHLDRTARVPHPPPPPSRLLGCAGHHVSRRLANLASLGSSLSAPMGPDAQRARHLIGSAQGALTRAANLDGFRVWNMLPAPGHQGASGDPAVRKWGGVQGRRGTNRGPALNHDTCEHAYTNWLKLRLTLFRRCWSNAENVRLAVWQRERRGS